MVVVLLCVMPMTFPSLFCPPFHWASRSSSPSSPSFPSSPSPVQNEHTPLRSKYEEEEKAETCLVTFVVLGGLVGSKNKPREKETMKGQMGTASHSKRGRERKNTAGKFLPCFFFSRFRHFHSFPSSTMDRRTHTRFALHCAHCVVKDNLLMHATRGPKRGQEGKKAWVKTHARWRAETFCVAVHCSFRPKNEGEREKRRHGRLCGGNNASSAENFALLRWDGTTAVVKCHSSVGAGSAGASLFVPRIFIVEAVFLIPIHPHHGVLRPAIL